MIKEYTIPLTIMAIVGCVIGGAVVWAYMTFTIVERAELNDLKEDQTAFGECVASKSAALDTAEQAQAEAERLKAK